MNSHTLFESNNHNSIYCTNKRDGHVPKISETEYTGLRDDVDVDFMLGHVHRRFSVSTGTTS